MQKGLAEKRIRKTSNIVKNFNRSEWDNGWSEPEQIAIIGVYASITTGESNLPRRYHYRYLMLEAAGQPVQKQL